VKKTIHRRQFLHGAAGATVALPFLPSIAHKAFANERAATIPKHFFAIATYHGGVVGSDMYPPESLLKNTMEYAGRTVRYGDLTTTSNNGKALVSEILSAPSNMLTPALLQKINVLRGLDIPWYIGHNAGGLLGNLTDNGGHAISVDTTSFAMPTIDQILANSKVFYPDDSQITRRSMQICARSDMGRRLSWNYSMPANKTGPIVPMSYHTANLSLFNSLLDPAQASYGLSPYLIDKVLHQYKRLRNNPRISAGDMQRLDQHMERLYSIEKTLKVTVPCNHPTPQDSNEYRELQADFFYNPFSQTTWCDLMIDVIVQAFSCGVCRIGSWGLDTYFNTTPVDNWHTEIAHAGDTFYPMTHNANQAHFEKVFLKLANKMNEVTMADGSTLLDNALILWTHEAGQRTHYTTGIPIITSGGLGGSINTGKFVDYRDMNANLTVDGVFEFDYESAGLTHLDTERPGLLYNQLMATILQTMGLQPTDYETGVDVNTSSPVPGYGFYQCRPQHADLYTAAKASMGETLPVITG